MNLYLISQDHNDGYDVFDEAVVAAESAEEARNTHPFKGSNWDGKDEILPTWSPAELVKVEMIGVAKEHTDAGVICASFKGG